MHYALIDSTGSPFLFHSKAPALYHMTARDLELVLGPERFHSYFTFAMSRNPYDRVVSLFHDFTEARQIIRARNFAAFVRKHLEEKWQHDVHFKPQSFFLYHEDRRVVDRVYAFEDGLESALADVGQRLGFVPAQVGKSRQSTRGPWQDYYRDPHLLQVINTLYAEDFERFGYEPLNAV